MKMKSYARHKTIKEIRALCKELDVPLNDHLWVSQGWDTVVVGTVGMGHVIYNTFNGCFYGQTDKGVDFSSNKMDHEKERWFEMLLDFFYVENK